MEAIKDKVTGTLYYESKPENCREASREDFFDKGILRLGMPYLIYSYHYEQYQVYRVNQNFKFELNVGPWMKDGRVFVATGKLE